MSYTDILADPTRPAGNYGTRGGHSFVGQNTVRYDFVQDKQQRAFEAEFRRLVQEWTTAVRDLSSMHEMVGHPAYLQIIGKGPQAIPYIIRELQRQPDHWFAALEAIVGDSPVMPDQRGDVVQMCEAWLEWAEREGYA